MTYTQRLPFLIEIRQVKEIVRALLGWLLLILIATACHGDVLNSNQVSPFDPLTWTPSTNVEIGIDRIGESVWNFDASPTNTDLASVTLGTQVTGGGALRVSGGTNATQKRVDILGDLVVGDKGFGDLLLDFDVTLGAQNATFAEDISSRGIGIIQGNNVTLDVASSLVIGGGGISEVSVASAGRINANSVIMGRDATGFGALTLNSPTVRMDVTDRITVGQNGAAFLDLESSSVLTATFIDIGKQAGSMGNIQATGQVHTDILTVGDEGVGEFVFKSHGTAFSQILNVGSLGTVKLADFARINSSTMNNYGKISGTGYLFTGGNNHGTVIATGSDELTFTSGLIINHADGHISTSGSGELTFNGPLQNDGQVLSSGGSQTYLGGLTNNTTIALTGDTLLFGDVTSAGEIIVANSAFATFHDPVVSTGNITVMDDSQVLFLGGLTGSVASSSLRIEGVGDDPAASLQVVGDTTFDGMLSVSLDDGIVPALGDEFTLATSTGLFSGSFDTLDLPSLTSGLAWSVDVGPSQLALQVVIPTSADFDSDGDVDGVDFLTWQRGFGIGTSTAEGDANGDNIVNAADLAIWESQYGGTSAAPALTTAVPEPGGLLLVSTLLASFMCKARYFGKARKLI